MWKGFDPFMPLFFFVNNSQEPESARSILYSDDAAFDTVYRCIFGVCVLACSGELFNKFEGCITMDKSSCMKWVRIVLTE